MDKIKKMAGLVEVMNLQYQRTQQNFKVILQEEMKLRDQLKSIAEHEQSTKALTASQTQHLRAMGGDVLWAKWLENSKVELNHQLARVLAQKEFHLSRVRMDFGKHQSATTKAQQMERAHKKKLNQERLDQAISLSMKEN